MSSTSSRPSPVDAAPKVRVDPDELRRVLPAQLRRHLRPILEDDLQGVAARSGVAVDTLRKLRRGLRRGGLGPSPSLETVVAVALVSGLSLDAVVDGCKSAQVPIDPGAPVRRRGAADGAVDVSAPTTDPLGSDLVATLTQATAAERPESHPSPGDARASRLYPEPAWPLGLSDLLMVLRDVQREDQPRAALAAADVFSARARPIPRTPPYQSWELPSAPHEVTITAGDPWALAYSLVAIAANPKFRRAQNIPDSVAMRAEIAPEEVGAARNTLSRARGRGARVTACNYSEVAVAFRAFLDARGYATSLPFADEQAREMVAHQWVGGTLLGRVVHLLYESFCVQTGLTQDLPGRRFLLGTAGRGRVDRAAQDEVLVCALWPDLVAERDAASAKSRQPVVSKEVLLRAALAFGRGTQEGGSS